MPARTRTPAPAPSPTPGRLIREARRRLGLTQEGLAARTGVSRSTLAGLERDRPGQLRLDRLLALASTLGIEPGAIDPRLEGILISTDRLRRGQVTLVRCAGHDALWEAEGDGMVGVRLVRDANLGALVRSLVERGIEVCAPALPPVE
jgi:transcriptional regulator with XRE-family HTH domain